MNKIIAEAVLLKVADIFDTVGVPFFLIQGTALGAYRDKGFTPTELDIDFAILQENFNHTAGDIAKHLVDAGAEIESWSLPFTRVKTLVAKLWDVKVDIVGHVRWKDKRFTSIPVITNDARAPHVGEPYALVHNAEWFENYDTVELFGREFKVPSPIEEYLAHEYGEDWRIPKKDHVSRTRIYDFIKTEGIPHDLFEHPR